MCSVILFKQPSNRFRAKKFCPVRKEAAISDYGEMTKTGDVIGVLLEFKEDEASLTFYRNKVKFINTICV